MSGWINRRFGTSRGLLRSLLGYLELITGRLHQFRLQNPAAVRRVVYVCLGNICRSAYAVTVAKGLGVEAASLGLSTTTGASSPIEAVESAQRNGVSLQRHRAVDWSDFEVRSGDLFVVMEIRQAHELRRRLGNRHDVQVCLLGMWCSPSMPHLHDPFTLSPSYFDTCFARVRQATIRLNLMLTGPAVLRRHETAPGVHPE